MSTKKHSRYTKRYHMHGSSSYTYTDSKSYIDSKSSSTSISSTSTSMSDVEAQRNETNHTCTSCKRAFCNYCKRAFCNCYVLWTIIILVSIGLLLLIILLPLSYYYVEYDKYALDRNKIHGGGGIDYKHTYEYGRYFWGVGHTTETIPRILQLVEYKTELLAFTTSGLEFMIECSFHYRIPRNGVTTLFRLYHQSYSNQIRSVALRALKNVATEYSLDEYITKRKIIHLAMYNELVIDLSTLCGDIKCIEIPHPQHFQLRKVVVPTSIHNTWLLSVIRIEENIAQQNIQTKILVEKETERLESIISANITLINIARDNEIALLIQSAKAEEFRIINTAKGDGKKILIDAIGLIDKNDIEKLLDIMLVLDSKDTDLKKIYRNYNIFNDGISTTKVIFGASDAIVTV